MMPSSPQASFMEPPFFDPDEPALLTAFRTGVPAAFAFVYDHYYPALLRFAQEQLGDLAEAEDVVSDSFLALWARRAGFYRLAAIRSFLYTTMRNACADHWRQRSRAAQHLPGYMSWYDGQEAPDLFKALLNDARWASLLDNLRERLPARARQVFDHAYQDGMSNAVIAALLGVHVRTVQRDRALIQALLESGPFKRKLLAICRDLVP